MNGNEDEIQSMNPEGMMESMDKPTYAKEDSWAEDNPSNPDEPFKAHIGFISPQAEFTPKTVETPELRTDLVYRLRLYVKDSKGQLRQGMPITVKLQISD